MIIKQRFRAILTGAVVAICCLAVQQAHATENDPGIWTIFSSTGSFPDTNPDSRWHYWFDAQARYFDLGSGANQWLVRPGIGYEIGDGVKAWVGYARFRARNGSGRVADENRYWQQVDWRAGQWQGGRFAMRIRLEQRSIDTGDDVGVVLRFMTKYVRPFPGDGSKSLVIGVEPFFDLKDTDWGGESGLGQNRVFVGMSFRTCDRLTLETGYMNQYIWRDNASDRVNHLAILTIKANF